MDNIIERIERIDAMLENIQARLDAAERAYELMSELREVIASDE